MNCPSCEHDASRVLESRRVPSGREATDATRRRRECLECGFRFTTYERVEQPVLWVVKDGRPEGMRRQPFDREKLLRGIARACSKRNVGAERLEALVIEIECELRRRGVTEITSEEIGGLALAGLFRLDHVAYVRFASVYRQFDDVAEFRSELDRIARTNDTNVAHAT